MKIIRQGDVMLIRVKSVPENMQEIPTDKGRIILAYGEVTGHAHAITLSPEEIVDAAIRKARFYKSDTGQKFLVVKEPVNLTHEEHTAAEYIPAGIYEIPIQVNMTQDKMLRKVTD